MRALSGAGIFDEFFRAAKTSAFHVETKDSYVVDTEAEALSRFAAGEPPPAQRPAAHNAWNDLIQETTGRGVAVSRVRVVTVPHSTYTSWLISVTERAIANGEQIRWLPRHLAEQSGHVPLDDFWIFDRRTVAFNTTDPTGATTGLAVTDDPVIVSVCSEISERLWAQGVDHARYVESEHAGR
ncbi:DUF6879 family protein [Nocardia sp. NPDC050710]|uniref:DUF6879 family protein n=1 Tax=Nocardia sp. NPDC050710 TaxID=3157220 RepID=UPI00340F7160